MTIIHKLTEPQFLRAIWGRIFISDDPFTIPFNQRGEVAMTIIHKLTEPQFLRAIWGRIFISDDPFTIPFNQRIESQMLFYPTKGYHLSEKQYEAMVAAAKASGDEGFIVSIVEGEGEIVNRGEHWWCEFPRYKEYLSLPLVLENAIYSKNAAWGVLISHEDHALVGGSKQFVEYVRKCYPEWRENIHKLVEVWTDNPNGSWVATVTSEMLKQ